LRALSSLMDGLIVVGWPVRTPRVQIVFVVKPIPDCILNIYTFSTLVVHLIKSSY